VSIAWSKAPGVPWPGLFAGVGTFSQSYRHGILINLEII
jgi:hypothetical protein